MIFRVAHWDILHDILVSSMQGEEFFSVLMASVMYLNFNMQEEDILDEHTNGKCHLRMLSSTCKPLCNIGICIS